MFRLAGPLVRRRQLRLHHHSKARENATLSMPHHFLMESDNGNSIQQDRPNNKTKTSVSRTKPFYQTYFDSVTPKESVKSSRQKNDVVEHFRIAISKGDMADVHATYSELLDDAHASSHSHAQAISRLTINDLRKAMSLALGSEISYVRWTKKEGKRQERDSMKKSGRDSIADGVLVQQMFNDMGPVFNFHIRMQDCQRALASLVLQQASSSSAYAYFQSLCSRFKEYARASHSKDAMVILYLCDKFEDLQIAQQMWEFLMKNEKTLDWEVRDFYFHILFKYGQAFKAMSIAKRGVYRSRMFPVSQQTEFSLASFLRGISRAGEGKWYLASKMADELLSRCRTQAGSVLLTSYEWQALLMHKGLVHGGPAALRMVAEAVQNYQYHADAKTFNILLLCHERELLGIAEYGTEDDVRRLFDQIEQSCKVKPDRDSFSIGISTLLGKMPSLLYRTTEEVTIDATEKVLEPVKVVGKKISESFQDDDDDDLSSLFTPASQRTLQNTPGQIHEATLLYKVFRSYHLIPDKTMAHSLITAHATTYIPSLSKAVELYKDLRSCLTSQGAKMEERIDRLTYDVLLTACARSRDLTIAQEIIQDLINDGITLNESNAANLVVLLMEASHSHQAAYESYCQLRDAAEQINQRSSSSRDNTTLKKKSPFSKDGWSQIIHSFTRLSFHDSDLPPVDYILEMMNDMIAAGVGHDVIPYASYLRLYGHTATSILSKDLGQVERRVTLDKLQDSVIQMHKYFQSQTEFEPDMAIVTALMDAYNRVRLPHSSLEIWNRLILNHAEISSATIAVVLDGCGYGGLINEARRVWKWTRSRPEVKTLCNKGVWDAYVECLARCGHLSEAINVVFDEMQPELLACGHESVDAKTMEMMLRFASHTRHRWTRDVQEEYILLSQIKTRMKREMPNIWNQVKMLDIPLYGK